MDVDCAGKHIGGPDGYRLTTAKINSIIDLPAPINTMELHLFLGCWNQPRHYVPDYQHSVDQMQKLLRKDVPFIWDQNLQTEFNGIKQILRSPLGLKPYNKKWRMILYTIYSSKGVGFALMQENPDNFNNKQLIFCGSSSLSE